MFGKKKDKNRGVPGVGQPNPFDEFTPETGTYTGKKRNPKHDTIVEVTCEGCIKPINVRLTSGKGNKTISCHNCLHVIEIHFSSSGGVRVYQSGKMGEGRHETSYDKVWHEGN